MADSYDVHGREYWNRRHAQRAASGRALHPRSLLTSHSQLLPKQGRALDVAAGLALNGLFLARHGLSVTAVDFAESGLRLAMTTARQEKLDFQAVIANLSQFVLPPEFFAVIVNTMFLDRNLFDDFRRALQPGGLLFFESLSKESASAEGHYIKAGEMRDMFSDYSVEFEGGRLFTARDGNEIRQTYGIILRKPC
ncbi:MAG: class I SAM-dependent methyltransferase [Anaerolineales bacterium]|jgi:tellurite methyltransferase